MKYSYTTDEVKQRQNIFESRFKIKYVCHKCGHVHNNSVFEIIVNTFALILVIYFGITGLMFFVDDILVTAALSSFMNVTEIIDTKIEQTDSMVLNFEDNYDLTVFTMLVLSEARLELNVSRELSDYEKIYYLHQAVISDTIYISDPRLGFKTDILYSPLITLHHGGDCEDRTVLFLTIAKISNLDCRPVFTNRHLLSYCIYDENKMIFVDSSNDELGLNSNLVSERLFLY